MPAAQSRRIRRVIWFALATLIVTAWIVIAGLFGWRWLPWLAPVGLAGLAAALATVLHELRRLDGLILEQTRIREALRASEAKFSGILSIAADAIVSIDDEQRIVHFNRGAEEIFGYEAADVVGRPLSILLPTRVHDVHAHHVADFARAPESARRMGERREIFGRRRDGTEFPAEASISKLDTPGGHLFTVVLRDVTERKRAAEDERFLAASSSELASSLALDVALQAIADAPIPRLADGCIVDFVGSSDRLERVTSVVAGREIATPLHALGRHPLTWDSPSPIVDVIRRRRSLLVSSIDDEWLEGNEEPALIPHWKAMGARAMLIVPLSAGGRSLGAMTLLATDPKRRFSDDTLALADKLGRTASLALSNAQLYDAAQRANRARDEVLGVVSHDLRNPLSTILMGVSAIREMPPDDVAGREKLLNTISEATSWMNRMIQDLLDVASIERGALSLERKPVPPALLVTQAMEMFVLEAESHGIALSAEMGPELPQVSADDVRIVQVLGNLLRNAIKFTPNHGRITMRATRVGGMVEFSVSDTGSGIEPEAQSHVFDRYWKAIGNGRTRGTGLGLSIAKGIVEAHGGHIWVDSAVGKGATFTFSLPASG
jgi:PAS domain S-box-containing protein